MNDKFIHLICLALGSIFILLGSLGIFFGIIAIIDPGGTKMSDDADPLGAPPTLIESLTLTSIFLLTFVLGIFLIVGSRWIRGSARKLND